MKLPENFHFNNYLFSFDTARIDVDTVHNYLAGESYWAQHIPMDLVVRSIENSICLGIYEESGSQVGFGRLITDRATFAYLADIFVLEPHRGKGLSKMMVQAFCDLATAFQVRRFMLATLDAHSLYAQFGFEEIANPERLMGKKGISY